MSSYNIVLTEQAEKDLNNLRKSEPTAYKKAISLIEDISITPTTGIGKPEPLKGNKTGLYSRRISKKHRLIYKVEDEKIIVIIISAYGHYDDK
ncbi:Txe/YoeB family addiction module toxin [Riemerella anatipestifer]|uniref:Txe/YoeB family addiction module toxin n=1 Tax=Riemerella anatipestifer TaxID=34085 RepID=UPI00129D468B|nr:Txe/YoeB family addiction module toxin [Riemerella anatipestifer]MRM84297.1 Txe/YoeB family addiction module toxin [Riemerella anatipestifer]